MTGRLAILAAAWFALLASATAGHAGPRFTRIWATTMEAQRISGRSDRDDRYLNAGDQGAALPHPDALGRRIRITYPETGKQVLVDVVDVGPWNVDDAYWTRPGGRPAIEATGVDRRGRRSNGAGLDLSPATWISLGAPAGAVLAGHFSGWVDWEFTDGPPVAHSPQP